MTLIEKIHKIWLYQKKKYQKKGVGNVLIGFSILVGFLKLALYVGERVWPQNLEDKRLFVLVCSCSIQLIVQTIAFCVFLPGYLGNQYYKKYQINKNLPWPWKKENWNQLLTKNFLVVFAYQVLLYPFLIYHGNPKYRFTGFPTMEQVVFHMVILYFLQDFFSYWSHRTLHHPKLYRFHKMHHSYQKVHGMLFQYNHPVQYVAVSMLPSLIAFTILGTRLHCFTAFVWIVWKVAIGLGGHGGYDLPWSPIRVLPLVGDASLHDHHHSNNVGNYSGSCIVWDVMLQTGETYFDEYLKAKIQ